MFYLACKRNANAGAKWYVFDIKSMTDDTIKADEYAITIDVNFKVVDDRFVWSKNVSTAKPKKVSKKYALTEKLKFVDMRGFKLIGTKDQFDDFDSAVNAAVEKEIADFERFLLR
jgi:hypothetical protein